MKVLEIQSGEFLSVSSTLTGFLHKLVEIKPCGLVSRIRDMEAEYRPKVITDLSS